MNIFQPKKDLQLEQNFYKTSINGLYFIAHESHPDSRGFFTELSLLPQINKVLNNKFHIQQINHAHSRTNVIRGFHAENWSKLVHIISGAAFCALADIRPDSKTFGKVETFLLGSHDSTYLNGSLFIESGIANSICVIKGPVDYLYHVDQLYSQRDTSGDEVISLFDPDLDVDWPIPKKDMIMSERDMHSTTLRERFPDNFTS